jgi:hypothetical protein
VLLYRYILFTNTTIRYITVLDVIIVNSSPNITAAPKLHPIPLHADFSPPILPLIHQPNQQTHHDQQ